MKSFWSIPFFLLILSGCLKSTCQLENIREENSISDKNILGIGSEPSEVMELNLQDSIQLALYQNLDLAVAARQLEFQEEVLTAARYNMLPKLFLEGVTSFRNKNTGAFSRSLEPGVPPAPPSVGVERKVRTWDVTFTWNLLDFGVSYFRARQEANKTLVQAFEYERTAQKVIFDVVRLFWKLAAESKGADIASRLQMDSIELLEKLQQSVGKGYLGAEQGAHFLSQVVSVQQRVEDDRKIYENTLYDFKTLLGLPPQVEIRLVGTEEIPPNPTFPSMRELEDLALEYRPELFEKDLQIQSSTDQARVSFVQAMPELAPFIGKDYDGNRFLIFSHWWIAGLRASWNLLAIPGHIAEIIAAKGQENIFEAQRLQQSLAIIAQLHLAYILYLENQEFYRFANMQRVQQDILREGAQTRQKMRAIGDVQVLIAEAEAYQATLDAGRRYGELVTSIELINNTLGLPFYIKLYNTETCL